jgi:hypothetical protein
MTASIACHSNPSPAPFHRLKRPIRSLELAQPVPRPVTSIGHKITCRVKGATSWSIAYQAKPRCNSGAKLAE